MPSFVEFIGGIVIVNFLFRDYVTSDFEFLRGHNLLSRVSLTQNNDIDIPPIEQNSSSH